VQPADQLITFESAANNYQQIKKQRLGQGSRNKKLPYPTTNFLTADSKT
jgi:hypothetical protein